MAEKRTEGVRISSTSIGISHDLVSLKKIVIRKTPARIGLRIFLAAE